MKIKEISSKYLIESLRFNSSYHLSDAVNFERLITERPHKSLGELTNEIFTSGRVKRIYTSKYNGVPYLGNNEIRSIVPLAGCKYISKKFFNDARSFIKKGMILTGRVGQDTVGQYTFANETLSNCLGSDNVIRIVTRKDIYNGFVYAFLASKYGYALTRRHISGAAQPFITEQMLASIPIPLIKETDQKRIHNLIIEAQDLRASAIDLLSEVESSFLQHLGISSGDLKKLTTPLERNVKQSFLIDSCELSINTLRARNYSKRKRDILSILRKGEYSRLSDVLKELPFYGSRYKRVDSSDGNGIELLSQADIFSLNPSGRIISKKTIKNLEQELVKKATIIVPAQGTLGENEIFGRAWLVWGYLENKIVAGHAMRFIPDETKIRCGYLFTVLNSPLWFRIFRSSVYGTNLLGFIIDLIKDYPIPRLSDAIEFDLDSQVKNAFEMISLAVKKEAQAIAIIEQEIESWQK